MSTMNKQIDVVIKILEGFKLNKPPKKKTGATKVLITNIEKSDSKSDVSKFSIGDLKKYCSHYHIDTEGVKTKYVKAVWEFIEEQYDSASSDESDSDDESDNDSDEETDSSSESDYD